MFSEWLRSCGFAEEVHLTLASLSVHSFPELSLCLGDNARLAVLRERLSDTLTLDLLVAARTAMQQAMLSQFLAHSSPPISVSAASTPLTESNLPPALARDTSLGSTDSSSSSSSSSSHCDLTLCPSGSPPPHTAIYPPHAPLSHNTRSRDESIGEKASSVCEKDRPSCDVSSKPSNSESLPLDDNISAQVTAHGHGQSLSSSSSLPVRREFAIPPSVRIHPLPLQSLTDPLSAPQNPRTKVPNKRRRDFNWQPIYSLNIADFTSYKEAHALALRLKDFPGCVNEHRHSFNNVFRCRESLNCQHLTKVHHDEDTHTIHVYQCDAHFGHPLKRSPSMDTPRRGLDSAVKEFIEKYAREGLKPRKIFDLMQQHNEECTEEHRMLHLPTMKQVQNYYDRTFYVRKRSTMDNDDNNTNTAEEQSHSQCDGERKD